MCLGSEASDRLAVWSGVMTVCAFVEQGPSVVYRLCVWQVDDLLTRYTTVQCFYGFREHIRLFIDMLGKYLMAV